MKALPPIRMESIAQIHAIIGRAPPPHPLLSVIAATWQEPMQLNLPIEGRKVESELYVVSLKRGDECHVEFGRQRCDGQAGTLVFLAPGQSLVPLAEKGGPAPRGEAWTLVFHPELLRGTRLAEAMHEFRFFGYAAREALHLSDDESATFTSLVKRLESEASTPPDEFSADVLTSQLQLLFSYCQRAYARQFDVRAKKTGSVAAKLDRHLDELLSTTPASVPTVSSCAKALGYSADYLSDLLRAETGKSARAHIQTAVIEAAKARLLAAGTRSSEVAFALGFEHPQHFTRLFRRKTGCSPAQWRRAQRTK